MGGLAHTLEDEGIATTQISLIRLHTEKIKPPRALALAALGTAALAAGAGVPAEALAPRYLRRADAEEKRLAAAGSLDTDKNL